MPGGFLNIVNVLVVGVSVIEMGKCSCKNICLNLPNLKKNYKIASFCSECDWWTDLSEKSRCVCCNQILRTNSRSEGYEKWKKKWKPEERLIPAYQQTYD